MSTFSFSVPGQPPSWNASYRIVSVPHRGGGSHRQMAKTSEAATYQLVAANFARRAMPKGFTAEGRVRIYWQFYLTRLIDSDNLIKILSDSLEHATGINDRMFNHCIRDVVHVKNKDEARVEVIVSSDPACRCCLLDEGGNP